MPSLCIFALIEAPTRLRFSEFFLIFIADFRSHLGKWVKLIKIEAEYEHLYTWKVGKPRSHCLQKGPYFKDLVLNKDLFGILGP